MLEASIVELLPADHAQAILVGRVLLAAGPTPVLVRGGEVLDVSAPPRRSPTCSNATISPA
jgi:fumarylacetoacetate (FAA) hydrolase family protein